MIDVLSENKEFVIGPAITLVPQLFSLPLLVSALVLGCRTLEDSWLRHFLIVSYWISLTPQWTSFFLYIVPSSLYWSEWRKTSVGRWMSSVRHRDKSAPTTAFTVLSVTREMAIAQHWLDFDHKSRTKQYDTSRWWGCEFLVNDFLIKTWYHRVVIVAISMFIGGRICIMRECIICSGYSLCPRKYD